MTVKKSFLIIAPRTATREMRSGLDLDRMLDSGSWVTVSIPKSKSRNLGTQRVREHRQRAKEKGFRYMHILLSPDVIERLHAQRGDGETMADVIDKLLSRAEQTS